MNSREEGALARAAIIREPRIVRGASMNVRLDGQQIFDWRWRIGATAEKAAEMAGVSVSTWLRVENGRGAVTLETARKIARLLEAAPKALERR
jgi:DNA-binding XRE family transcriptional regulator